MHTYFARSHHHTTTDSIERIRSNTSTSGDTPTQQERCEEVAFEVTDQENRLEGVVHSEVETTVDDYTEHGWTETTVQSRNTIRGQGLAVDVDQTVELTAPTTLSRRLGIIGKTGTAVVSSGQRKRS